MYLARGVGLKVMESRCTEGGRCDRGMIGSYIGEVKEALTESRYITDERLDIEKINPFTLTMPDNQYWSVGKRLAQAWKVGKNLREEKVV